MDADSGRNILMIEDESDVADLLEMTLRKAGFKASKRATRKRLAKGAGQPARFHHSYLMLPKMPASRSAEF